MDSGKAPAGRGAPFLAVVAILAGTAWLTGAVSPLRSAALDFRPWADGKVASFTLASANGGRVTLESHRGRIVLVHFFATWCEPCREELPALRRLVERASGEPLTVLAISVAEVEPRVRRFLETMPVNFPVLLDQDRTVARAWNISTLPSTILLDRNLEPRLMAESDVAWDAIEPRRLVHMLTAGEAGAHTQ